MTHNAYRLAGIAGTAEPDALDSPGAAFLLAVQQTLSDLIDVQAASLDELAHEAVDAVIPIYTYRLWTAFVDLAAWTEDTSELAGDSDDLTSHATAALYLIGKRLADALLAERVAA